MMHGDFALFVNNSSFITSGLALDFPCNLFYLLGLHDAGSTILKSLSQQN